MADPVRRAYPITRAPEGLVADDEDGPHVPGDCRCCGTQMGQTVEEDWVREAERLHDRYLIEVVEAFGLCPWAQRARLSGDARVAVLLQPDESALDASMDVLERWTDEQIQIGFLVYPRLPLGRTEFDCFAARLRTVDVERHGLSGGRFAMATFHPDAEPNLDEAERLIPFLRRTPDACIQAVSMEALDRVRRGGPGGTQFVDIASIQLCASGASVTAPLRERIARANLETVRREGVESLSGRFEAIRRDRARTYELLEARDASARRPAGQPS